MWAGSEAEAGGSGGGTVPGGWYGTAGDTGSSRSVSPPAALMRGGARQVREV